MLKIMFIDAVNHMERGETFLPTLGLAYMASTIRKEFGSDHTQIKIVQHDIEQAIDEFKPDIVGISSVTKNFNRAIKYARIAKEKGLPVIAGGIHISALPSTLSPHMDAAVIGEGEYTFLDLARLYINKGKFEKNELEKIDGIAFKRDNELITTKKRKPIEPLDSLPMPARDLFNIENFTYMFTSRGCPYRCTYCTSSRFWGKVRLFSAEYVVNEIEFLYREYHVKKIGFWDDLFVVNKARVIEVRELLEKRGLLGKLSFSTMATSNLINDELAMILKQMGVSVVNMGLESGCPRTLEYLKGKGIRVEDHVSAIKTLRRHGLDAAGSFILDSPNESLDDVMETIRFIRKNPLSSFSIFHLTPLPGTPLWDYAKSRGLVSDTMDWEILDVNSEKIKDNAILLSEKLTRDDLVGLIQLFKKERDRIFRKNTLLGALKNPLKLPGILWKTIKTRFLHL